MQAHYRLRFRQQFGCFLGALVSSWDRLYACILVWVKCGFRRHNLTNDSSQCGGSCTSAYELKKTKHQTRGNSISFLFFVSSHLLGLHQTSACGRPTVNQLLVLMEVAASPNHPRCWLRQTRGFQRATLGTIQAAPYLLCQLKRGDLNHLFTLPFYSGPLLSALKDAALRWGRCSYLIVLPPSPPHYLQYYHKIKIFETDHVTVEKLRQMRWARHVTESQWNLEIRKVH